MGSFDDYYNALWSRYLVGGSFIGAVSKEKASAFRSAIARDIEALTRGFKGKGRKELPRPERDLTTYRDALASAQANCKHENAIELLWRREWCCDDCGRILGPKDMPRRGLFG